jgi:ABC-type transporter Mla MlaB component
MPAPTPETLVDDAAQAATLHLPAELTIYTAAETRTAWLNWLADQPGRTASADALCAVDASGCDEIDAAGAQLLVALAHSLARQQRRLQLQHASTPVRNACRDLGLAGWLLAGVPMEVPA